MAELVSKAGDRSAKLLASFEKLSIASHALNVASDTLGREIKVLDEALNKLNPGVTAWVNIVTVSDEDTPWAGQLQQLGYAKVGGRWGLCLATTDFDERVDQEERKEWLFSDAPRELRLKALALIPPLIEALAKKAAETADAVNKHISLAREATAIIAAFIGEEGGKQ